MAVMSANMAICEAVLTEKTSGVMSLIRTMNVLNITGNLQSARFFTVVSVNSEPGDFAPHNLQVQMFSRSGSLVASAPEHDFSYGYEFDRMGFGAYTLTTEFVLNLAPMGNLGAYTVVAYVDTKVVARTPLLMRRV
jgi:hypothetical protein